MNPFPSKNASFHLTQEKFTTEFVHVDNAPDVSRQGRDRHQKRINVHLISRKRDGARINRVVPGGLEVRNLTDGLGFVVCGIVLVELVE